MQPDMSKITNALAQLQVIAEAVTGYHKKLVDGGIPAEIAGQMAHEFHETMMDMLRTGANKQQARR